MKGWFKKLIAWGVIQALLFLGLPTGSSYASDFEKSYLKQITADGIKDPRKILETAWLFRRGLNQHSQGNLVSPILGWKSRVIGDGLIFENKDTHVAYLATTVLDANRSDGLSLGQLNSREKAWLYRVSGDGMKKESPYMRFSATVARKSEREVNRGKFMGTLDEFKQDMGILSVVEVEGQEALVQGDGVIAQPSQDINPYILAQFILGTGFLDENAAFNGRISEEIEERIKKGKVRMLVIGRGAGRLIYEMRHRYPANLELVFMNKDRVEASKETFIQKVLHGQATLDDEAEVERFLDDFQKHVILYDVDGGLTKGLEEASEDRAFDIILLAHVTLPYIQNKYELLRDIQGMLVEGGIAFINLAKTFDWRAEHGRKISSMLVNSALNDIGNPNQYEYSPFGDNHALIIKNVDSGQPFPRLNLLSSNPVDTHLRDDSGRELPAQFHNTYALLEHNPSGYVAQKGDGIEHFGLLSDRLRKYSHMDAPKLIQLIQKKLDRPLSKEKKERITRIMRNLRHIRKLLQPVEMFNAVASSSRSPEHNLCCEASDKTQDALVSDPAISLVNIMRRISRYTDESSTFFPYDDGMAQFWADTGRATPQIYSFTVLNLFGIPLILDLTGDQYVLRHDGQGYEDIGIIVMPVDDLLTTDWPYVPIHHNEFVGSRATLSKVLNGDQKLVKLLSGKELGEGLELAGDGIALDTAHSTFSGKEAELNESLSLLHQFLENPEGANEVAEELIATMEERAKSYEENMLWEYKDRPEELADVLRYDEASGLTWPAQEGKNHLVIRSMLVDLFGKVKTTASEAIHILEQQNGKGAVVEAPISVDSLIKIIDSDRERRLNYYRYHDQSYILILPGIPRAPASAHWLPMGHPPSVGLHPLIEYATYRGHSHPTGISSRFSRADHSALRDQNGFSVSLIDRQHGIIHASVKPYYEWVETSEEGQKARDRLFEIGFLDDPQPISIDGQGDGVTKPRTRFPFRVQFTQAFVEHTRNQQPNFWSRLHNRLEGMETLSSGETLGKPLTNIKGERDLAGYTNLRFGTHRLILQENPFDRSSGIVLIEYLSKQLANHGRDRFSETIEAAIASGILDPTLPGDQRLIQDVETLLYNETSEARLSLQEIRHATQGLRFFYNLVQRVHHLGEIKQAAESMLIQPIQKGFLPLQITLFEIGSVIRSSRRDGEWNADHAIHALTGPVIHAQATQKQLIDLLEGWAATERRIEHLVYQTFQQETPNFDSLIWVYYTFPVERIQEAVRNGFEEWAETAPMTQDALDLISLAYMLLTEEREGARSFPASEIIEHQMTLREAQLQPENGEESTEGDGLDENGFFDHSTTIANEIAVEVTSTMGEESIPDQSILGMAYSSDFLLINQVSNDYLFHIVLLGKNEGETGMLENRNGVQIAFEEWVAEGEKDMADPVKIQETLDRLKAGKLNVFLKTAMIPRAIEADTVTIINQNVFITGIKMFIERQPLERLSDDQREILQQVLLDLQV